MGARSAKTLWAYDCGVSDVGARLVVGDAEVADLLLFWDCRFDISLAASKKYVYPGCAREEILILKHVVDVLALLGSLKSW